MGQDIDMFDEEFTLSQLLFKKFKQDETIGRKYIIEASNVKVLGEIELGNNTVFEGILINAGASKLVFSNVYLKTFNRADNIQNYVEFIVVNISNVISISQPVKTNMKFAHSYRLELEELNDTGKNIWLSTVFMGETLSGNYLFLDYELQKAPLMLTKDEIKSVRSMTVEQVTPCEEAYLEKEYASET